MAPIKMVKIVHCICVIALLLLARADAYALSSLSMAADSGRIRRLPLVAGNWKMNTDLKSATSLAKDVVELTKGFDQNSVEIAVIPPYPFLRDVGQIIEKSGIKLGAQNAYSEPKGAFTGAVSAPMLASLGVTYSLVGHSERRKIFRESDEDINKNLLAVHNAGLTPILCIGETKEEFDQGRNEDVCTSQLTKGLQNLSSEAAEKLVIAYEPVWAIGTGLTATPEIAQSVHALIRRWLSQRFGTNTADKIRILYGGSVTPESVDELMKCPDIDGALVGGASLVAKSFARIALYGKYTSEIVK